VVFFTFINSDMVVPPAFENARTSNQIPFGTKIIYSIGGYSYSQDVSGWRRWFGNADSARNLAHQVASWKCDGIDLDIEDGAGNDGDVSQNMVVFAQELRRLRPDFIITQPVFGYPQVLSESLITVNSWNA
jgi:Glycosyl hydrolases family 18